MSDGEPAARSCILHVEDELPNRVLLRAVVSRSEDPAVSGALLLEAEDIAGARRFLASDEVDVVLLDVRLPDGDGLDLAAEIRGTASSRRPWIVIMSASVLPSQRSAALDAGADLFVAKPYVPSELTRLISDLLA